MNELLRTRAINAGVLATQEGRLNELLEEQGGLREAALAFEEARENLKYLEQQQELLETIGEYGLNATEVLRGLTLGVGASPEAVTGAMTRALEAVIWQTQEQMALGGYPVERPMQIAPTEPPPTPPGGTTQNFYLTINTNAPVENVIEDFEMMQSYTQIPGR